MALTVKEALSLGRDGYHSGHRLILPFKCIILKLVIEAEIFTEMVGGKHIQLFQDPHNTSVYIRGVGKLSNYIDSYRSVKLVVCEMDDDLCDLSKHVKLICHLEEGHAVRIHAPSGDDLFIE